MSCTIGHRLSAALVGIGCLTLSASAYADPPSTSSDERGVQAQELFDSGQKVADADPKRALAAFRASYAIRADYRVLYHVAKACSRLGDNACAAASFDQYLKDGGSDIPAKQKKEVEAALKAISKNSGTIAVKSNAAGAYVKLDGVVVGRTPLDKPLTVSVGTHKVVLVSDGNVVEKSVTVERSGSAETVEIALEKRPAPAAPPEVPEPKPEPKAVAAPEPKPEPAPARAAVEPPKNHGAPVVPWVITGALAAGTGVAAYFLMQANTDYNQLHDKYPVSKNALDDAHDRGRNFLFLTGGLGAATLVAAGISGIVTLSHGGKPAPEKSIALGVGPGGIALTGKLR